MATTWTSVKAAGTTTYNFVNPGGQQAYDDPLLIYDDPNTFYDSVNQNFWSSVATVPNTSWTSIAAV